jgi:hypothetical protein
MVALSRGQTAEDAGGSCSDPLGELPATSEAKDQELQNNTFQLDIVEQVSMAVGPLSKVNVASCIKQLSPTPLTAFEILSSQWAPYVVRTI